MHSQTAYFAAQSDPDLRSGFRRRWADQPMTARELEHAADLEMALGNAQRADLLPWQAHLVRMGASS